MTDDQKSFPDEIRQNAITPFYDYISENLSCCQISYKYDDPGYLQETELTYKNLSNAKYGLNILNMTVNGFFFFFHIFLSYHSHKQAGTYT